MTFSIVITGQSKVSNTVRIDCKKKISMPFMYNHVKIFKLNGEKFVFCHHDATGETKISPLDNNSFIGYQKKWSKGWTNIDIFEYKGKTYLFHQKSQSGLARISELNYDDIKSGKRLGPKIYESKWTGGWTTTKFFDYQGKLFFFHLKEYNGQVRINVSEKAGDMGKRVYESTWSKGWTDFGVARTSSGITMINQKFDNGDCAIKELNTSALISAYNKGTKTKDIGKDTFREMTAAAWSHTQLFTHGGNLYLLKAQLQLGNVQIYAITHGKIGKKVYEGNWGLALSAVDIYIDNKKPYLVRQKNLTKKLEFCEIEF